MERRKQTVQGPQGPGINTVVSSLDCFVLFLPHIEAIKPEMPASTDKKQPALCSQIRKRRAQQDRILQTTAIALQPNTTDENWPHPDTHQPGLSGVPPLPPGAGYDEALQPPAPVVSGKTEEGAGTFITKGRSPTFPQQCQRSIETMYRSWIPPLSGSNEKSLSPKP